MDRPSAFMRYTATILVLASLALAASSAAIPASGALPRSPVSARVKGQGFHEILEKLGGQGDVRLTAVRHLADRRVTLIVEERALREVMRWFEALWSIPQYPARWRVVTKGAEVRYELWQDPRAEQELQRRLAADRQRIGQSLALLMLGAQDPSRLPARGSGDIVVDRVLNPPDWNHGGRSALRILGELRPEARSAVLNGQPIWVPFESLSPETRTGIIAEIGHLERRGVRQPSGSLRQETDEEALTRFRQSSYGLHLELNPANHEWYLHLSVIDPEGRGISSRGNLLAPLGESNREEEPSGVIGDASVKELLEKRASQDPRHVSAWKQFADFQEYVADQTGLPVLSDFYRDKRIPASAALTAGSFKAMLDAATEPIRYRWWSDRGALLFRNRLWFLDDLAEVPASLVARLLAARKRAGYLGLGELAEVARLTDKQLKHLEEVIPGMSHVQAYRRLLAWHDALDAKLKRLAESAQGLPLRSSGPRALALLYPGGARADPLLAMFPDPGQVRISIRQERQGEQVVTIFDVFGRAESHVRYRFFQQVTPPDGPVEGTP